MIGEILDDVDIHEVVRSDPKLFNGKVERVWAKVFNFRTIYVDERYAAHAFYSDPNMPSLSKKQWVRIIDGFYSKYSHFAQWHIELFREVVTSGGKMISQSGREYTFTKYPRRDGAKDYKRAQIYNYPVQGTARGEILPIALVMLRKALLHTQAKIVNTVHDSIILDSPQKYLDTVAEEWYNILRKLPAIYKQAFGYPWRVPLDGEIKIGPSWGEMRKYETSTG